ncbi:MAG: tellurite resistance TerB family protein [Beijerinckiaceae bacterium]
MFDAKSLLNMVLGAAQQGGQAGGQAGGGLGGMIGQVLGGLQGKVQDTAAQAGQQAQGAAGGLTGMLGQVMGGLQGKAQEAGAAAQNMAGGMQGNAADALAQAQNAIQTGNYAGLADQAKALLQGNAGGLLAGGLAGLALGTKGGRSLLGTAAKLGGVALVGGLAYKAFQNYQAGKPLTSFGEPVAAAPQGSGFAEGDGDDQERALLMVRAMIAAAAADGEIDDAERARIVGNLKQAGLDDEASGFLDAEFANPQDAASLVAMSTSPEMAAQIYTAARLAVDPDTDDEQTFLADLSSGLELDAELVAHIDAAAASVMESQQA